MKETNKTKADEIKEKVLKIFEENFNLIKTFGSKAIVDTIELTIKQFEQKEQELEKQIDKMFSKEQVEGMVSGLKKEIERLNYIITTKDDEYERVCNEITDEWYSKVKHLEKQLQEKINYVNTIDEINAGLEFQMDNLEKKLQEQRKKIEDRIKELMKLPRIYSNEIIELKSLLESDKNKEVITIRSVEVVTPELISKIMFPKKIPKEKKRNEESISFCI